MPTQPAPGTSSGGKTPAGKYTAPTSGPVTPREIYQLLLDTGFNTTQALGIMANSKNESTFNPESIGDQGTSYGFVQFHNTSYPGASSLVTGNAQKDIRAQIKYLAQVVSPQALAGNSPSEVAGNFAEHFEECVGCQPGGAQYNSRVGNVAALQTAASTGDWGNVTSSSVGGAGGSTSAADSGCLISIRLLGCIFTRSQGRAVLGGLLLAGGGIVMAGGILILVATAFSGTKAGGAVAQAAGNIPGAGGVAARATSTAGKSGQRRRAAGRAEKAELQAKGASNIRTARKPAGTLGKPTRPGRKIGTYDPERDKPPF